MREPLPKLPRSEVWLRELLQPRSVKSESLIVARLLHALLGEYMERFMRSLSVMGKLSDGGDLESFTHCMDQHGWHVSKLWSFGVWSWTL